MLRCLIIAYYDHRPPGCQDESGQQLHISFKNTKAKSASSICYYIGDV